MYVSNDTESAIESRKKDLIIPYNCEFIIVEAKNSGYKLTEIYSLKNKTFTFEYGVWDLNQGLKCTDLSFYWRRINLSGVEIKTLVTAEEIVII